jgi:Ran GTPase-activating protein (RanGAP) involved in mRNA processing and transport
MMQKKLILIKHLDLESNKIGPIGIHILTAGSKYCPELDHFNFSYNLIGYTGVKSIAYLLSQCSLLTHFSYNPIGYTGVKSIAYLLSQCPLLTHLYLDFINLGNDGAKKLAEVLSDNNNRTFALTHLNLNKNNIGDTGIEGLTGLLLLCPALSYLCLYGNNIGDTGANKLSEALCKNKNPTLSHIDLRSNNIGNIGAKSFASMLKQSSILTQIDLRGNKAYQVNLHRSIIM